VQAEDSNNDHDNDNNDGDGDGDDERLAGPRQATALLVLTRPSSGKQSECRCNACVNLQPGEPVLVDVSSANPPLTHTQPRTAIHRHPSPPIAISITSLGRHAPIAIIIVAVVLPGGTLQSPP
jgi:hypothetical protein